VTESVHERHGATIVHVGQRDRFSLARSLRPWRRQAAKAIDRLGPDLVHGQGILTGGLPACDVEARPRVVTAHGDPRKDTLADYRGLGGVVRARLRDRLARGVVRRADAVVGVHPEWQFNLSIPPRRFEHIPNIVDRCFFDVAARREPGRVLYCGGPSRIKGWDVLLAAWPGVRRAIPDATLQAAGWRSAGDTRGETLDGVNLLSALSPNALAEELGKASVVVIPSRYEVAPLVLSEAWAAGTPVVATTVGGLATLASGAAALVPAEDPHLVAAAIIRILGGDDGETPTAVAEGRRRAQLQTAGVVAAAHRSLYERLMSAHG
jgi:glycosyltransferase involved in cell wall biosynthesis